MKIGDLFNFEDIQQVITIGNIKNEQEMVEKFVISPNLKSELFQFLEYLKGNKPEDNISVEVIGNYGTGKSHLLSFLSIILSNPDMIQYIQDEELRDEFSKINREFVVVKQELPAQDKKLEDIFFHRVHKQLKENYGIEIRKINSETEEKDPKELIEEIMGVIKEKYPNRGLIVIFDEYSDFLKSKESHKQQLDLNFTRQLAECSINQDFILMLSMQEYIFSNPEYKDKADLINKIEKRFLIFNITSENIEDIIAKRMVTKTPNQIQDIKIQFETIKNKFPNIAIDEDRYIKLFPVHPHLIEMFSRLTYFESRSMLTFISDHTKQILNEEFPKFITYDLIYDELIESEQTIKNKEDVKPVIEIVNSLRDIVPKIPQQYQNRAEVLINALAIKNLASTPDIHGEKMGGDTPEGFAENLCILPNSSFMDPPEDISTILNMLIKESQGQFISHNEDNNNYFINLSKKTDYEQIINNKASNMDDLTHNNEVFVEDFLLSELVIDGKNNIGYAENDKKYVLEDTVTWNERNSFRRGTLAINIGNKLSIDDVGDYLVSIKCFGPHSINEHELNHIKIKPSYSEEFNWSVRRLAAVNYFIKIKAHTDVMKIKRTSIIDQEVKPYFKDALKDATIEYKTNTYTLEELGITSDITSQIFSKIKEELLGEELVNIYPEYPKFKSDKKLSKSSIESTMDSVLKEMSNKTILSDFDLKSRNILIPLELYKNDSIDVHNSKYASIILDKVESTVQQIKISEIVKLFEDKPYGMQKEITYFLIAVLLRNGNIMISNKNGKTYSSSDFSTLFKSGLKIFKDLKYIKQEDGPTPDAQLLFDALDLDRTLLISKKDYILAVKSYAETLTNIESDIVHINNQFNNIIQNNSINLPIEDIKEKIDFINNVPFDEMEVKSINDFNKLDYSKDNLDNVHEAYILISNLKSFLIDYNSVIYNGINYMEKAIEHIDNDFFKQSDKDELNKIYQESKDIINNPRKLLKHDERRPLEGKIELFKDKYKNIYYIAHENFVGKNVDWESLDEIKNSITYKKLEVLSRITPINSSKFREIQKEILSIKDLQCTVFNVDELDISYHCSCGFPQTTGNHTNINGKIIEIREIIPNLFNSWESEIITIVDDNKEKINQLDSNQQDIIDNIIVSRKLPEKIDYEVVSAVNSLLEDVEIKELNLNVLFDVLTSERDTLKVDEVIDKIEDYVNSIVLDKSNARIKLTKDEGE